MAVAELEATDGTTSKYCIRYAESEILQLTNFPASMKFRHVIVIPAYREGGDFLSRLQQLSETTGDTLVIAVINQPQSDTTSRNVALYQAAMHSGHLRWGSPALKLLEWQNNAALLVVDRCTESRRIPDKQGVGLARKVGCDLAVALALKGILSTRFIHSTDADAFLPNDYLLRTRDLADVSAAIYPFRHRCDCSLLGRATALYEQSLRYYVAGLAWAGSSYAFHTVGSCLALSIVHYAQARGFQALGWRRFLSAE
ncbi:hypothetical protein F6455_14950 [Proteobacteria bacterium 005FR1]|nr:hypothetical protein [Proteobacteria bacterium 005FR1]